MSSNPAWQERGAIAFFIVDGGVRSKHHSTELGYDAPATDLQQLLVTAHTWAARHLGTGSPSSLDMDSLIVARDCLVYNVH